MTTTTLTRQERGALANNGIAVQGFQKALSTSEINTGLVPAIFMRLTSASGWRRFIFPDNPGQIYEWNSADFRQFVEGDRPAGCQTPCRVLERMLQGTPAHPIFLELTRGTPGGANNPEHDPATGRFTTTHNRDDVTVVVEALAPGEIPADPPAPKRKRNYKREAPTGNSRSYALSRLKREREDLYRKVLAEEMSSHAAMIEAGFREPTLTIPLSPRKAAKRIVQHMTRQEFSELVDEGLRLYLERGT